MRNVPLDSVDAVARPVLAIGTDYPPGTLLDTHTHRRAQVLYGMSGVMEVETDDGAWAIPPYSGVWIPAGKPHRVRMQGVSTRSLYIEPAAAPRPADHCEALVISLCCTSCCWPRRTCLRCTTRTGVTERWRNCCCMRCARRRRCPCSRRSPRPPACTAVQGIPEVAQHPGHAPGMGAATAQEPAHLHALLSPADGYEFWGMAAASLPAGGAAPAVGRAVRHAGGAGSGLRQPQRVFLDVQATARQDANGVHLRIRHGRIPVGVPCPSREISPSRCKHAAAGRFCLCFDTGRGHRRARIDHQPQGGTAWGWC